MKIARHRKGKKRRGPNFKVPFFASALLRIKGRI